MIKVIEIEFENHCPMVIMYDNTQYSNEEIEEYANNYDWGIPWFNKKKKDVIIMSKEDYETLRKLFHNNFEMIPKKDKNK